jgi:hypothetical protein
MTGLLTGYYDLIVVGIKILIMWLYVCGDMVILCPLWGLDKFASELIWCHLLNPWGYYEFQAIARVNTLQMKDDRILPRQFQHIVHYYPIIRYCII